MTRLIRLSLIFALAAAAAWPQVANIDQRNSQRSISSTAYPSPDVVIYNATRGDGIGLILGNDSNSALEVRELDASGVLPAAGDLLGRIFPITGWFNWGGTMTTVTHRASTEVVTGVTQLGDSDTAGQDSTRGYGNLTYTGTYDGSATLPVTGAGTRMMWIPELAAFRAGQVIGTEWNTVGDYSVALGYRSTASASGSVVGGGEVNTASGLDSTIAGGTINLASGATSFVGGGSSNQATNTSSAVSGGTNNIASGARSTIAGGIGNTASAPTAAIGGGQDNVASGSDGTTQGSVVAGGYQNTASGRGGFNGAGSSNTVIAQFAWNPGGHSNVIESQSEYSGTLGSFLRNPAEETILTGINASISEEADYSFIFANGGNVGGGVKNLPITSNRQFMAWAWGGIRASVNYIAGTSRIGLTVSPELYVDGPSGGNITGTGALNMGLDSSIGGNLDLYDDADRVLRIDNVSGSTDGDNDGAVVTTMWNGSGSTLTAGLAVESAGTSSATAARGVALYNQTSDGGPMAVGVVYATSLTGNPVEIVTSGVCDMTCDGTIAVGEPIYLNSSGQGVGLYVFEAPGSGTAPFVNNTSDILGASLDQAVWGRIMLVGYALQSHSGAASTIRVFVQPQVSQYSIKWNL